MSIFNKNAGDLNFPWSLSLSDYNYDNASTKFINDFVLKKCANVHWAQRFIFEIVLKRDSSRYKNYRQQN